MTITESLAQLVDDGVIDEVLGRIMCGKEAEVFAVTRRGQPIAAKVYKPRYQRSFKNNSSYLEGRNNVRDTRARRAIDRGSAFGKEQQERGWKEMEHDALQLAWQAGVRVPQPIFLYEDTLLMQLVVDNDGMPAPRLCDLALAPEHAEDVHRDVFEQIRKLLKAHRIHGDLSAYNVLMGIDGPTIIDMPQVIDAASNQRAEEFLVRDVKNVTEHLARFSPKLWSYANAGKALWKHYRAGTLDDASIADSIEYADTRRVKGRPEGKPRNQPPQRVVHPDGRVEVVIGANGGGRKTRGFSRDGRAQDRGRNERRGGNPPGGEARPPRAAGANEQQTQRNGRGDGRRSNARPPGRSGGGRSGGPRPRV